MRRMWYVVGAVVLAASGIARVQLVHEEEDEPVTQTRPAQSSPDDPNAPRLHSGVPQAVLENIPLVTPESEAARTARPATADLSKVLAAARKGIGEEPQLPLSLVGEFITGGQQVPVSLTYKSGGRHRQELSGTGQVAAGFDGRRNWTVSSSETADSGELAEGRIPALAMWVMTGAWLQPNGPCKVLAVEGAGGDGLITLSLRIRNSEEAARLVLDSRTHRPSTLIVGQPTPTEIWRFEDYRTAHGVTLPYLLTRVREKSTATYRFSSLNAAPEFKRSPFNLALETPPARDGKIPVTALNRPKNRALETPRLQPSLQSKEVAPGKFEATPQCEPQVVEHVREERKPPSERNASTPVARMNTEEHSQSTDLGPPTDPMPEAAPKPVRPDQEKPSLNGL